MPKTDLPTEADKTLILKTVDGLPPMATFWDATPDQRTHLRIIKEHFQDLKQALNAYFTGQQNPVGKDDPKRKKFIDQEVRYYLRVYELFWFGWAEIESEVVRRKQSDASFECFPNSPGEALAFFFELDCEAMAHVAFAGGSISAHESYILLDGIPDGSFAKGSQKKRVDRTLRYANQVQEHSDSDSFINFCRSAVKKRLRGNSALRTTLKDFDTANSKRFKEIRRMLKAESIQGQK